MRHFHLHIDFETACLLDLKKVGLYRYIEDGSFTPLCVAWKLDADPPRTARLDDGGGLPVELWELLQHADVQAHAWNAAFEDRILRKYYGVLLAHPLSCTMQRALAYGLPGKLERAGPALGAKRVKDMAGARLMRKMSKAPGATWTAGEWSTLLGYCTADVMSEAEIAGAIPWLSPEEVVLSEVDRAMNNQGVWVDTGTVKLLAQVARDAEKLEATRASELSGGAVTSPGTQTERLQAWLETQNVSMPNMERATVEEALRAAHVANISAQAVEMLRIRLRTARASAKKLIRIIESASSGDRLRGQFQFLGAGRTGRWAGRGVQVQNLPRVPKGFSPQEFLQLTTANGPGLDAVSPAPILDCVSWSLRSCLGAGPGVAENMWSLDFSQIEARVLAWLAGQNDVLEIFRSGVDVYVWAADQFGSKDRQLGKVLVLSLGFGTGAVKLRKMARENYGVEMSAAEAEKFKDEWRRQNRHIVAFWREIEAAARGAILQRGNVFPVLPSQITLTASAKTLKMRLPSGRLLYYHKPAVAADGSLTYWGEEKGAWRERRTWGSALAENATQAVARDIMSEAMMRTKLVPLMTVHDELVYPAPANMWSRHELECQMLAAPAWAGGLPIAGESKVMKRYGVIVK